MFFLFYYSRALPRAGVVALLVIVRARALKSRHGAETGGGGVALDAGEHAGGRFQGVQIDLGVVARVDSDGGGGRGARGGGDVGRTVFGVSSASGEEERVRVGARARG